MIGRVAGTVLYRANDHVMIDVHGLGYLVYCSDRTLAGLPGAGAPATLFTDLLVKEDLLQLMGFASLAEKEWFRLLLSVQGVGAKAALAILGALGPEGTGRAIALGDAMAIRTAQGIGPKIAQRVVHELKDKAPAAMALSAQGAGPVEGPVAPGTDGQPPAVAAATAQVTGPGLSSEGEAISALANLGYGPADAAAAVARARRDAPGADTPELIRAALRLLAPAR